MAGTISRLVAGGGNLLQQNSSAGVHSECMNEQEKSGWMSGFWLTAILISIAYFVIAIAATNMVGSHISPANACINRLRQIDAAANQSALENHLTNGSHINFPNDLTPYIKLDANGKIPSCPAGGVYHISNVGEPPTCSPGTAVTPGHCLP